MTVCKENKTRVFVTFNAEFECKLKALLEEFNIINTESLGDIHLINFITNGGFVSAQPAIASSAIALSCRTIATIEYCLRTEQDGSCVLLENGVVINNLPPNDHLMLASYWLNPVTEIHYYMIRENNGCALRIAYYTTIGGSGGWVPTPGVPFLFSS